MDVQTICEKIRGLKLDQSWNMTMTKFINNYQSHVILLESITVDPTLLWPEKLKMIMLASAVMSNKGMPFIMSQEHQDVAKGHALMMYNQYLALLKSRAQELDNSEKTSAESSHNRSIQKHEHGGHSGQNKREDANEEPPYDCNEGQDYNNDEVGEEEWGDGDAAL